jgi:hypothetical protein
MEFGNVAQLIGERRRVKQLPACVGSTGTSGRIRREELSRRNGFAMGNHKVTDESDLTAVLQFGCW